ncbi:light-harvesting complex-like protein OHP2, chloroplastic isoform X2 [Musa acuminata AAA Group]|uniref:light-harvesting complex-like protein OHP2, chloroplastic isoform X2 n=1 Tax=Musa acuminata AAA Group TaxID=214697 RepID=UPI0031DCAF8A
MVTLEYQRRVAEELQDYFKQKKLEEADQGPFFGFLGKNEISNGREGIFKMELEAFECCSTILDLVSVTQECDMSDIQICNRTADRVCDRHELRSTAKDPYLQFWNH